MAHVTVNGIELHFDRAGEGPPLLLLHGLGSSARDWENQVAHFKDTRELIVPDFRGHGRSDKPAGPYSIEGFASDIAGLVDELGIGPAPVVGISLGGMVGFQLAADRPDLVDRLIAVNALQVFEMTRISQRIQVTIRKIITKRLSMEKIGDVLSKHLFTDPDMDDLRAKMVERWAENDKAAYESTFQAILDWDGVKTEMSNIEVPITVISSDLDYLAPDEKQPYIDAMPTAETVVIKNAHHAVPMERPDRFNAALEAALS
ncbi:MAG: alpha/beta fold hydrolase [Actinomycetota bacterium]